MDVIEDLKFLGKLTKKIGGVGFGRGVGGRVGGVRVDVNEELKFLGKFTKKIVGGGPGGLVGEGGGQAGCERRIEVFVTIKKNIYSFFFLFFFFGGGGSGRNGRVWGGQNGCDRRIEVFGKIHKKNRWVGFGREVGVELGGSGWM